AEVAAIAATLDRGFPPPPLLQRAHQSERAWSARSVAAMASDSNPLRRFGLVLAGFVALVLFVACTNLANLVLARGTTRQQEFAVRHALGASRSRLLPGPVSQSTLPGGCFIGETMFVKCTVAEPRHDPGIEMGRLGVAVLNVQTHRFDEARLRRALDRVVEESRGDSRIEALAVSTGLPFGVAGAPS